MEKLIDLHIHTVCSDGVLTPKEVIDEALANKVSTIAICDHDTIEAYNEELFEYAKEKNIKLILGVEISTKTKKCGIHVLGYNFDLNNKELREKLLPKKIIIRDCNSFDGLSEYYFRVCILKPEENRLLIKNLKTLFA